MTVSYPALINQFSWSLGVHGGVKQSRTQIHQALGIAVGRLERLWVTGILLPQDFCSKTMQAVRRSYEAANQTISIKYSSSPESLLATNSWPKSLGTLGARLGFKEDVCEATFFSALQQWLLNLSRRALGKNGTLHVAACWFRDLFNLCRVLLNTHWFLTPVESLKY